MFPLTWPWIRFNVRFLRHTHILVDPFQQSKFVSISSQQIVFITSPYKRVCSFIYTHFYIIYSAQLYTLSNQTYMLPSYLYMWDDIPQYDPCFPNSVPSSFRPVLAFHELGLRWHPQWPQGCSHGAIGRPCGGGSWTMGFPGSTPLFCHRC